MRRPADPPRRIEAIRIDPEVAASTAAGDHVRTLALCREAVARWERGGRDGHEHIHLARTALDHGDDADRDHALAALTRWSDPRCPDRLECLQQWGLCALLLDRRGDRGEARAPALIALSSVDRRSAAAAGLGDLWDAVDEVARPRRRRAGPGGILARARRRASLG